MIRGMLMAGGVPEPIAESAVAVAEPLIVKQEKKISKKAKAYQNKYRKAFSRVEKNYKKKSGCWKKGGYRLCVKEAHAIAKKMR